MEEKDFSGIPIVVLESLRIRLSQLVHSLTNLNGRVSAAELGSWPAVQQQFMVCILQLNSLASTLQSFAPALQRCVAYPMPNFPAQTSGWLLTTLLRKKTLPEVDEWIAKGLGQTIEDTERDNDFCEWALEHTYEAASISVDRRPFPAKPAPSGWSVDKVIGALNGKMPSEK